MGIVLKRRDNAPIVKDVFGGALDILMEERNIRKAQAFVHDMLTKVITNQVPLEKFIITKSLRDDYKNPDQIAHRVLADRMARRDPGTAPKVGDRLPFIYIAGAEKGAKQGDRIEHLDYVRANKLQPDTTFYITNQIQNPVAQLFALCIEDLDGYRPPSKQSYESLKQEFLNKFQENDEPEEDATIALLARKEKQLEDLMFLSHPGLVKLLRRNVRGPLDSFVRRG
jgi:DNA polymerase elongation subunit (family B)